MFTVVVSSVALVASLIALYRTHLARFKPRIVVGPLRLRVYPYKSGDESWVVPTFHVSISIANEGARAGTMDRLRVRCQFADSEFEDAFQVFRIAAVLERPIGLKPDSTNERHRWLEDAAEWSQTLVLPHETVTRHLVFQGPGIWDRQFEASMNLTLEGKTSRHRRWRELQIWILDLETDDWPHLIQGSPWIAFGAGEWDGEADEENLGDLPSKLGGPPIALPDDWPDTPHTYVSV